MSVILSEPEQAKTGLNLGRWSDGTPAVAIGRHWIALPIIWGIIPPSPPSIIG
jgi:hypothetical protein